MIKIKRKNGFSILAVILVIVAVIVAIGIWALSGQSNTSNTSKLSGDIAIEGMLNDAVAIKSSIELYKIANGAKAPLINSSYIFERPKVNPKLIRVDATPQEGVWTMNFNNFYASYVGDNAKPDVTILLGGITDEVCKKINLKLQGKSVLPVVSSSSSSQSVVYALEDGVTYTYMYLANFSDIYGWDRGCFNIKSLPDNNVFFMVAIPL